MAGEDGESPEEDLLRFQYEDDLPLKAANLGFDMDRFTHKDEAGKELIQVAIDGIHVCMLFLLEADLASAEARNWQIRGLAYKLMLDTVRETLETGRTAAFAIADEAELDEGETDG